MRALLAILLAGPVLGCSATSTPSGGSAEPGGRGASAASAVVDAEVEVVFRRVDDRRVEVSLSCAIPEDGVLTLVAAESWGGVAPCAEEIRDLRWSGEAADAGASARPDPHRWRLEGPAGRVARAVWTLSTPDDRLAVDWGDQYRPIVTRDLFHTIGAVALVSPEHLEADAPVRISLRFDGFRGEALSSFSRGPGPHVVELPFDRFRHAVFLAGDVRVHEREIRGAPLRVGLHGSRWAFRDGQFVDLVERIVRAERAFFADWDHPAYLVSLVPIGADADLSFRFGGTGLTESVALFMAPGATLAPGMIGAAGVRRLLAHECFHQWNGIDIGRQDPEEEAYWFSEGFTDFYARRLLHREGIESLDGTLRSLNRSIREYWTSPARAAPNRAIVDGFWTDEHLKDLPYRRGDLVALVVDQAIREASRGERSLDDLMRSLHAAAVADGTRVSTASLLAEIERRTSPDLAAHLREVVVEGATIELPARLDEPPSIRTTRPWGAFDLGFDVEASRAARAVTGVRPGSAAAAAGLRDGLPLHGLTAYWNDVEKPVEIDVEIDGDVRRLSYLPVRDPVEIPAYRPLESAP
ncbi:MAG: hypothetical protein ACF8XB_16615 [Planctomycetota bacterium JB042]